MVIYLQIVFTVTQRKINWKPSIGRTRKWNVIKDLYINNLSKSQVFVAHSLWVICRNVSRTFVEFCMETPCWCTVLFHKYGRQKSTKTSGVHYFYKKLFLFTRELANVRINIKERLFFNERPFLFWCYALWKLEVQIAVFSKWNMLREWKLVQRFTFCLSST